jgi:hypothetical protein
MNKEYCKEKFWQWLETLIEAPAEELKGWAPCPYAKSARQRGEITIRWLTPGIEQDQIDIWSRELVTPVMVYMFDPRDMSADYTRELVELLNRKLMPLDRVLLEDHPDDPEVLNGLGLNFGHCGLILAQSLSKLNSAADQLRKQGYYESWPQENLQRVVTWRYIS